MASDPVVWCALQVGGLPNTANALARHAPFMPSLCLPPLQSQLLIGLGMHCHVGGI